MTGVYRATCRQERSGSSTVPTRRRKSRVRRTTCRDGWCRNSDSSRSRETRPIRADARFRTQPTVSNDYARRPRRNPDWDGDRLLTFDANLDRTTIGQVFHSTDSTTIGRTLVSGTIDLPGFYNNINTHFPNTSDSWRSSTSLNMLAIVSASGPTVHTYVRPVYRHDRWLGHLPIARFTSSSVIGSGNRYGLQRMSVYLSRLGG